MLSTEARVYGTEDISIHHGPLFRFEGVRLRILADTVAKTMADFSGSPLDILLGEALYTERYRIKKESTNLFTRKRKKGDLLVLNRIQDGLLKSGVEMDRRNLMRSLVKHYVDEISGHFDPGVYRFATHAVPWSFSWLLNAASVRRFLPWGMEHSLQERITISGKAGMLQKLARKGTILLVPTHQSNIDSPLVGFVIYLMGLPPFSYGAGLNLFSNPVLSYFMSRLGAYTVDRRKTNAIYKQALKNYSTRILKEGIHSIFFPGGGRSRSGGLEYRTKLGLLGTALEAQIDNHRAGNPRPKVFVVPMVTSYHFVLEASSLIEDYLAEAGKHRFIITDDESWQFTKILKFFWKLFSSESGFLVRIGRPLDVFGNFVDEEGNSLGPNGTTVDPIRWFTTRGELRHEVQRDQEYTRELGNRLVDRFHKENTVVSSHLVAFTFFEALRKKYPDLDLYRFLRLSMDQRSLPESEFLQEAERRHEEMKALAAQGELHLSNELKTSDTRVWVTEGSAQLGLFHDSAVVRIQDGAVWTEDMNLLYYYRNRLSGYGISLLAEEGGERIKPGKNDRKGFLA